MEFAGAGGCQGFVNAGIEVAALPPSILAASVAGLSQDLFNPDLVLSCTMEWEELKHSH